MFLGTQCAVLILALVGDVVVLKNGNEIQGEILRESEEHLTVRFPGGTLEVRKRDVASIRRQSRHSCLLDEAEGLVGRGSYEDAYRSFEEALREDPGSDRARKGLQAAREKHAGSLEAGGRYGEAKAIYEEVLRADPASETARRQVEAIDRTLADARLEEQRALSEIGEGELEAGVWRLQRIHDRFPDRRSDLRPILARAIERQGHQLVQKGDWTGAEERYLKALTLDPDLLPGIEDPYVALKQRQILPLVTSGDFESAEKLVVQGLEIHPTSPVFRYYQGLCLEARGQRRDAAEEYLEILGAKRPADLDASASGLRMQVETMLAEVGKVPPLANPRWREVLPGDFRELRTARFSIRHKNESVARDVARVAEGSYARIHRELGCIAHSRNPIQIVVFPTAEEYQAASGLRSWSGGAHVVARRLGTLSDHRIYTFQGQPRLTSGVIPHEIAHALLAHRLNYPERIPLWANEGLAVTREPAYFRKHYDAVVAEAVARRSVIPLRDLLGRDDYPEDRVQTFYAQSYSLVEFLLSLEDLSTFLEFLRGVSRPGDDLEAGLRRHYRISGVPALQNRWLAWFERRMDS